MKVSFFFLAFLIIIFSFLPYALSSCTVTDDFTLKGEEISVYLCNEDEVCTMNMEDYIIGVVSAEMPASFSDEALKAQAVAARTYAIRKVNNEPEQHKGAELCTDFAHCQAYIDKKQAKSNWGRDYSKNINKIKNAVLSTSGQYLAYGNEPAITVFHSCSNGITEKASDVWGGDIAYLTNVESPGDLLRKDYVSKCEFTEDEFIKKLEEFLGKTVDKTLPYIENVSHTTGGNVSEIKIYGNTIKGTDVRKIFSLKSTSFELQKKDSKFVFTVTGNGHGVGMSQYGADKMAQDGKSCSEILYHYYPGTKIANLNN